jgi:hypothetical protein
MTINAARCSVLTKTNRLHIVDSWVREVGVIPDVKEVGGEPELLAFGDLNVLDQGEIPVLLKRAAVDVPPQITKQRYAAIAAS